jgi:hypothetical protein
MASQFVSGTYRSYKTGTSKILNWLYENAQKCGYGAEPADDEGGPSISESKDSLPKPKGKKHRRGGKGKKKAESKQPDTSGAPKHVPVKEFTALAEASKCSGTQSSFQPA